LTRIHIEVFEAEHLVVLKSSVNYMYKLTTLYIKEI
jgi:hypothetical protein